MKISVCIASYNGERYIKEQLSSILPQLSDIDEVLISDDSSTDDTVDIIKSLHDSRITLIENNTFYSSAFNFENALRCCSGDIIFLSDQDDIWDKNKVKKCVNALQQADLVLHDAEIIDANGNLLMESIFAFRKSGTGLFHNLVRNSYMGCCMAFKSDVLRWIMPFPVKIPMHDLWIGEVVEMLGKTLLIEDKLLQYRRHTSNVSVFLDKSKKKISEKISDRLLLLFYLLKRYLKNIYV